MHRAVGQCVFRDHRVFFFLSTAPNKAVNIFCKALILRDNILECKCEYQTGLATLCTISVNIQFDCYAYITEYKVEYEYGVEYT